jgi:hypothetical protein
MVVQVVHSEGRTRRSKRFGRRMMRLLDEEVRARMRLGPTWELI